MSMQLTAHFTKEEFEKDGTMPDVAVPICTTMCQVLEIIREQFAEPYIITSGYRTPESNTETGGVHTSEHIYTADQCASDGYFPSHQRDMRPVFDWIRTNPNLIFDQVILEHGENGDIVHLGLRSDERREALEGKTHGESKTYESWDVTPLVPGAMSA